MTVLVFFLSIASAQIPMETLQLEQLINRSDRQIAELKEILKSTKEDSAALAKASEVLSKLSAGIDKTLEPYKGSESYQKALLEVQSKDDYAGTFSDAQRLQRAVKSIEPESERSYAELIEFQKNSVQANREDARRQAELQKSIPNSEPGFLPKIQTQVALDQWQASTRISAQLTQLLASIAAMREELRTTRLKNEKNNLNILATGSEILNQKQREGQANESK